VPRTKILYVVIDEAADRDAHWGEHDANVGGLKAAVDAFQGPSGSLVVEKTDVYSLYAKAPASMRNQTALTFSIDDLRGDRDVFAIFGAGSFTEWQTYKAIPQPTLAGTSITYQNALDLYMAVLRGNSVPIFAVCGSHQLVAAAFNSFTALAHMNDSGSPPPATDPPPTWSRPGEFGTYPIALAAGAAADNLLIELVRRKAGTQNMKFAIHHCDMVVNTGLFQLLFQEDAARPASPDPGAGSQATKRCHVQGMKRNYDPSDDRLLYTTQFHPEMEAFGSALDDGWGRALLGSFFSLATAFWRKHP
jgi:hypothetical protein